MSHSIKNLEAGVRAGSSQARQIGLWQQKASAVETTTRSKKELPSQSLSCTQVPQTLGHALSMMRSEDKGSSPVAVEVIHVIHGGGRSSGLMMMKPIAKGALGSGVNLCEGNHQVVKQNGG
jgi:hypothetical protein